VDQSVPRALVLHGHKKIIHHRDRWLSPAVLVKKK